MISEPRVILWIAAAFMMLYVTNNNAGAVVLFMLTGALICWIGRSK